MERAHKESKTDAQPTVASEMVRNETDGKLAFGMASSKLKSAATGAPTTRQRFV